MSKLEITKYEGKPEKVMKKIIKYNTQIFLTWFFYILLGYKLPKEAIELIKNSYKSTPRELRLIERIENKNNKK